MLFGVQDHHRLPVGRKNKMSALVWETKDRASKPWRVAMQNVDVVRSAHARLMRQLLHIATLGEDLHWELIDDTSRSQNP
jgi:hypothetical protein